MRKQLDDNQLDTSDVLPVSDLGCATALVTAGFELLTLDRANPRKVRFVFKRDKGIEKVTDDFWANRLEVRARSFFDNLKMLKNRLYS